MSISRTFQDLIRNELLFKDLNRIQGLFKTTSNIQDLFKIVHVRTMMAGQNESDQEPRENGTRLVDSKKLTTGPKHFNCILTKFLLLLTDA